MRIKIRELNTALAREITMLDHKSAECQKWLSRFASYDLADFGLEGKGYSALTAQFHCQTEFLRTQAVLFAAVKSGDEKNRAALRQLSSTEPDGSVDTDHLEKLISDAKQKIIQSRDMRDRALNLPKSSQDDSFQDSLVRAADKLADMCNASILCFQKDLEKVHHYISISSTFYSEVEGMSRTLSRAVAASKAMAEGKHADMSWTSDVDNRWRAVIDKQVKKLLTREEWDAYKKATRNGWQSSDFYQAADKQSRERKNNKVLWKAMAKLPAWMLTSDMVTAAVKAFNSMANRKYPAHKPDIAALQESIRSLFASDGKQSYQGGRRLYGFKKSDLLKAMSATSDLLIQKLDMPSTKDSHHDNSAWVSSIMVNNLLHMAERIKPTTVSPYANKFDTSIWGSQKELTINLSAFYPTNSLSATARLLTILVEPSLKDITTADIGQKGTAKSLFQTYMGMSGTMSEILNFAAHLQQFGKKNDKNKEDDKNKKMLVAQDALKDVTIDNVKGSLEHFLVRLLPQSAGGGIALLFLIQDFASDVIDRTYNSLKGMNVIDLADAQQVYDSNPVFKNIGVIFNYDHIPQSLFEDYTMTQAKLFMRPSAKANIESAIKAYNKLFPKAKFSFRMLKNAVESDPVNIQRGAGGSDLKKTYDFITWCRQDADLVYKKDCYDHNDCLYHKAGEKVRVAISNFDFSSTDYDLYQFDPKAE